MVATADVGRVAAELLSTKGRHRGAKSFAQIAGADPLSDDIRA